ncbi:glycoside hydrolase family 2 TIM barrel-domain containing protein [Pontibacter sp. G13]|uniref:glycoside hydrolase family 2 TIM barrel-domain containing protein n=1 Tax=Pontibacter sp. G13 TaxID=3074898 RepID=UPI002889830E|nr:glycoside hydrolase family 2 TIM barrel-domain containing protein [Pontibacter sp. G13]WNJ19760.1 glycoside hydrolase family 2 TIM barrel-domain containing protein [Pontibacter sp. G13]
MRNLAYTCFLLLLCTLGCESPQSSQSWPSELSGKTVEIIERDGKFQLFRNGKPYFIRGAGGREHLSELVEFGGNSIRTWSSQDLGPLLDRADSLGLTVMVGLDAVPGRRGLDYSDSTAVAAQVERLRPIVRQFKDHPAVLCWSVGNELELMYDNEDLYPAINGIAEMVHEEDPNHPTTVSLGARPEWISQVAEHCPEIDMLSVNVFSRMEALPKNLRKSNFGWKGPYIVTEWSNKGFWESPTTDWDAPLEPTSKEKSDFCLQAYQNSISKDTARCLGGYVFYWGSKQERTHTWFSMFSEDGHKTSRVDIMSYLWKGDWPANRAPDILKIQSSHPGEGGGLYVQQGESIQLEVIASDPESDSLSYTWEVRREGDYRSTFGGDAERKAIIVEGLCERPNFPQTVVNAPDEVGAYRVFVYVKDHQGGIAVSNVPIFVSRSFAVR